MSKYIERPSTKINIGEAARRAGLSGQRFRRAVKLLRIPIERSGWTVLIDEAQIKRVQKALTDGTITRGRPKKKAQ